jgi:uncharacterized membrane protein
MSELNQQTDEEHEVGRIIHSVLIGGLTISVVLMLTGVAASIVAGQGLPHEAPPLGQLLDEVMAFHPGGLLGLGLVVLIATPFLRVLGTFFISLVERDWRYVLVTGLVFTIMIGSILLGKG